MARRPDEAIDQLRKTLQLDPHFAMTDFYLGMAYEAKQLYPQAVAAYRKAHEIFAGRSRNRWARTRVCDVRDED